MNRSRLITAAAALGLAASTLGLAGTATAAVTASVLARTKRLLFPSWFIASSR
jgi:hypothetical protein